MSGEPTPSAAAIAAAAVTRHAVRTSTQPGSAAAAPAGGLTLVGLGVRLAVSGRND